MRPTKLLAMLLGATVASALSGNEVVAAPVVATTPANSWTAKRIVDPFHNDTRCVVESARASFNDGHQDTSVYLRVDDRAFYIMTESNVDAKHADVGVRVDDGELIVPDAAFLDQHLQFESKIATVVDQFRRGLVAEVHLRFWPSWPDKGLKTVKFSLIGFTREFSRLPGC